MRYLVVVVLAAIAIASMFVAQWCAKRVEQEDPPVHKPHLPGGWTRYVAHVEEWCDLTVKRAADGLVHANASFNSRPGTPFNHWNVPLVFGRDKDDALTCYHEGPNTENTARCQLFTIHCVQ